MSKEMDFLRGVDKLHAFYTENVRMLAHAYDLTDEEASRILNNMDFRNVARSILRPPRVTTFLDEPHTISDEPDEPDEDQ